MLKQIFGLDISDHSIEALVLTKPYFGKPKAITYARTVLRGEIVKNGIIRKPDKLGENIVKLLESAQPKPIQTPYCIISLPESHVFTTIFKLPAGLKDSEIKNTIPYKAEEVIPFKSSEVYFDFKSIFQKDETQEVFYVAVPMKVVDSYLAVLKNIGLEPVAFDLESVSLARALVDQTKKSDQATLLMDIGARTTNLNIFDRGGIRQSIAIKIAGDRFSKAIVNKLKIAPKQADELKMKNGFDPKQQQGKVLLVLQNEFKRVIAETRKLIDFFQTQNQRQIGEVILVGGSALLPSIDQYLADNLGIEANLGNPFTKIADLNNLVRLKNKEVLFANVAGLALRGVGKDPVGSDINLLPTSLRRFALAPAKEEKKAWRLIYIRLAIFAVLVLVFGGIFAAQKQGRDFYRAVFPLLSYQSIIGPEINLEFLDQLREQMLLPATTTPTVVEEIVEPEIKVKIKQTSVGYLNVREGSGTNYPKIDQADSGNEYVLIKEQDDWYQIELDEENTGWVYSVYAELIEPVSDESRGDTKDETSDSEEEASTTPEEPAVSAVKIKIKQTGIGYLNVREGPSTAYDKVGQVLPEVEYAVLAEEKDWYKIEFEENNVGWVYSIYVDKLE